MSSIETRLQAAQDPNDQPSAAAARQLAEAAERHGLLDVAWARVDSPLGTLLAAATPSGLCALWYEETRVQQFLDTLARRISPRVLEAPRRLDPVRRELDEYFAGRRRDFDVPLDWTLTFGIGGGPPAPPGFTQRVLQVAARIPYGAVRTYREVAAQAGNPKASRAAGNALGANPLPIVVPCHRVVRTSGGLGGYTTGVGKKAFLLALEGA
ncbi:MAG: methylated-DNA--[protein]-cysteine S-methyltransferase [Egibacteraceae bacterium]